VDSIAGMLTTLEAFGPGMAEELRAGQAVMVADVARDARTRGSLAAYEAIGVRAHLTLPLIKAGALRIVLSMHSDSARAWGEDEMRMAGEMAERTWAAVETAAAQAELRAERDRSQYIFDTMTEGFALIARDWTVTYMNATGLELIGRAADEVIGRDHWAAFPEALGGDIERICRAAMESGTPGSVDYAYSLAGPAPVWMEVRVYPAMDGGLAVFFRDITRRRQAQEQLRLEAQRKDEFLAMLAHELRNPLAPIGAAAELLALGRLEGEAVRRTSAIVTRQVGHMTSLINDLLDVSRVTRGLVALEHAPVDLKDAVADAVEQVRPLVEGRHHRLEVHLAPEQALVAGDRKRLVQVLANLLNNAAKYTPDGGRVVLEMEVRAQQQVLLTVSDNGIGILPEVQGDVFGLFVQAKRSADRSQGGLGIGLALVKSLVELHGGTVAVHSAGPGQGSRFSVCLPRMAAPVPEESAGAAAADAVRPASGGRSVLVVDDNVDAAELLGLMLESAGHRVHIEHHPHGALDYAAAQGEAELDACLLDIGLPGMDGNALARALRTLPGTRDALLVAVTGYGRPQDREASLAAGFDHHLVKPVDIHELLALLGQEAGRMF
jgi:PAS domain S-box-containing protein